MLNPKIEEKQWSKDFEKELYLKWKENKLYSFNKSSKKKVYSIDTPPPYINTPVHIGQATTYALMDMFARYKRMKGYEVLFPLGLDKNGLPIEVATEKKYNIRLTNTPREKFIELAKELLDEHGLTTVDSFLRLGISFNSYKKGNNIGEVYETDSPEYRKLTQSTFIDLWDKKLIYEDERINNYCPGCKTTLADAEIEYEGIETYFNYVKFKVKETGEEIIIGTTRPELICTCGMVIFNPEDKRYQHLKNKTAITPIFEKEIKIKPDSLATTEKGTGLVMMCSAGDLSDIRFFRDNKLDPVIAIDEYGRMNKNAGFLQGLRVKEARDKIIETLKHNGLLVKQEKIVHRTPICERSKDHIEFISMKEFYLKQVEFKNDIKKLIDGINFYDKTSKQILIDWVNSVSIDWPISRRRYYATEVPLWYCKKCNHTIVPKKGKYYQPWKEKAPVDSCPKCKSKEFIGDTRVLDTWFDSSNSPLYILKYYENNKFFSKNNPCYLRPQGKEIVRTWLYYTLLKCYLLNKKPIFKDVWINYHVVDEHGNKMSKSKGNVIDPKTILDKVGAEPFRLWAVTEGNLTKTDFRCSLERIEGASKTINKLWNIARFISMFEDVKKPKELQELDKFIVNEITELIELSDKCYKEYDFYTPATLIKHFIWETFASNYIELIKRRIYNEDKKFSKEEQNSANYACYFTLVNLLKLLAPINPFLTYKIYYSLTGKDIPLEEFPKPIKKFKIDFKKEDILGLNSNIWKFKKEKNLSLKDPISSITIDKRFKNIIKDLKETHNIKEINFGSKFNIVF